MSEPYELEARTGAASGSQTREPFRNPSYPERDHFSERARLQEARTACEERINAAREALEPSGDRAGNADSIRLFHQLLGVRDQIALCVRRMPLETGELYDEDKELFAQATAALERVWQRWEKTRG